MSIKLTDNVTKTSYNIKLNDDIKTISVTVLKRRIALELNKQNIFCPPSWQCLWVKNPFRILGHRLYDGETIINITKSPTKYQISDIIRNQTLK